MIQSADDCQPIAGFHMTFCDGFDGTSPNTDTWAVYDNAGTVSESNGWLHLSSPGATFPYLASESNIFPTNKSFSLTLGFQYSYVGLYGDGIVAGETSLPDGSTVTNFPGSYADGRAWQDSSGLYADSQCSLAPLPIDESPHTVTFAFDYSTRSVQITVDGINHGSCALTSWPTSAWIGNPFVPTPCACLWSSLSVNYVRVDVPSAG